MTRVGSEYGKLGDIERCLVAGRLMRETWYARIYHPERVDSLIAKGHPVARDNQIPAWLKGKDSVRNQISMGGRGAGKSRLASGWFVPELLERPGYSLGILGPDFKVSVGVGIKGRSGIQTIIEGFDKTLIKKFDNNKNILYLVNGSIVMCFTSENRTSVEGNEFHGLWVDELAELYGAEGDDCVYRKSARPCVRLVGDNDEPIRRMLTGTPESTELILYLNEQAERFPEAYDWLQLATKDNLDNIDREEAEQWYAEADPNSSFFLAKLEGHLLLESPGALLGEEDFARIRIAPGEKRWLNPEDCSDVFMAVDANHSDDKKSDECGILIGGLRGRFGAVFADATLKGGPKLWGERIIEALVAFPEIDEVCVEDDKSLVIEVVERVLRDSLEEIGRPVKIRPMPHGNKSKKVRADPVAVEYQLKHVRHCPSPRRPDWGLARYEQQWKGWNPKTAKKSPDRVDAGVYLVTRMLLRDRQGPSWYAASDVTW